MVFLRVLVELFKVLSQGRVPLLRLVKVFLDLSQDRVQQRLVEVLLQRLLVVVFKGLSQDTAFRDADPAVGPQVLVPGQGSTALRGADSGVRPQWQGHEEAITLWMRKGGGPPV